MSEFTEDPLSGSARPCSLSSTDFPTRPTAAVAAGEKITAGTQGTVAYDGDLRYDFACPFLLTDDNVAGGPGADFVARSGAGLI